MTLLLQDAPFIVAVFAIPVKLADFVLPEKRDKVQAVCEDMTLHLEYTRPLEWFRHFAGQRVQRLLVAGVASLVLLTIILCFVGTYIAAPFSWTAGSLWFAVLCGPATYFLAHLGPKVTGRLCEDGHFGTFTRRYLLFTLFSALLIAAIVGLLFLLFFVAANFQSILLGLVACLCLLAFGLPLVGLVGFWWVMVLTGFCVVVAEAFLLVLDGVGRFLHWLAWRVVRYEKGALAALAGLITIALELVKVCLPSGK